MDQPPLDESSVYNYNLISNNTLENNDSDFEVYLHSTEFDDRLEYNDDNQTNEDPVIKLAHAIINHTNSIRDSSLPNENTRFVNRMTSAKYLPTFTGDPLDWLHFKQAYDMSTELGEYTERENIIRLFEALKGDARASVKTLFATGNNASEIIDTLEMQFGSSRLILDKVLNEIRNLKSLESKRITLVEFSKKLQNGIRSIKSLNKERYLNSPELADGIINKLPDSLWRGYIKYAAIEINKNKPDLVKVSDFLDEQAKEMVASEVADRSTNGTTSKRSERSNGNDYNDYNRKNVCATVSSESEFSQQNKSYVDNCVYCGRKNHFIDTCKDFIKAPMPMRWRVVRTNRLCYSCLKQGHLNAKCQEKIVCKKCGRNHHELLHYIDTSNKDSNSYDEFSRFSNNDQSRKETPSREDKL